MTYYWIHREGPRNTAGVDSNAIRREHLTAHHDDDDDDDGDGVEFTVQHCQPWKK